jgi:hypothetical protein
MLRDAGLELADLWYRQLLPKNKVRYPNFRLFEKMDQFATEYTPLRYFATNIEFVCVKPRSTEREIGLTQSPHFGAFSPGKD